MPRQKHYERTEFLKVPQLAKKKKKKGGLLSVLCLDTEAALERINKC